MFFPVMLDDSFLNWKHVLQPELKEILAGDFRNAKKGKPFEQAFQKLLEGLKLIEGTRG